ncbi:YitT family protein [Clostridium sp. YIM B02515]|uniref:YitT family protein n=1 Tax=Clostridium rhizosphaerae TaxID=2803861 RepID=A0ABS1T9F6_9CLOT|nr:YitT family protein [Clostridium rhizosphaerae]MBL4935950.1 YitT family protein [Clostridium rhizosphaerae]
MKLNKADLIKRAFIIAIASLISSVGLNMFIIPHKLLSGGVSGIALIVQYLSGIQAGIIIILINIPLFVLSIKELDKEFTILTIIGTVCQSIFLILTRNVSQLYFAKDMILSCICGGVMHGIALGLIFSNHGSLGGTDIISMIIRRRYNFEIGKISFGINLLIVSIGSIFFGIERGLYTLISMYIVSAFMDKVINGFDIKKMILIVTDKENEIIENIQTDLKRGCTLLYGIGTYSKSPKKIIYCVVTLSQIPKVKSIVESSDTYAFMTIIDTSEILGKGFKKPI